MSTSSDHIRLIIRGDDAGSCESADLAIMEACDHDIVRNVSVMVPGPTFAHSARLLAGRTDLCLGLHVTLNAEWAGPKWGPVLPVSHVPTLVDAHGYFLPTPEDLQRRGFDEQQAMAEVEAQLCRAREAGLKIRYLDEHMMVGRIGSLRRQLAEFCRRQGLVEADRFAWLPDVPGGPAGWVERLRRRLMQIPAGCYVLGSHPGFDRPDMRQFHLPGQAPGVVAGQRDAERRGLTSPHLPGVLRELGVEIAQYA